MNKNQCCCEEIFKLEKYCFNVFKSLKSLSFLLILIVLQQTSKWVYNLKIDFYKSSIEVDKVEEDLYFLKCLESQSIHNDVYSLWVHHHINN